MSVLREFYLCEVLRAPGFDKTIRTEIKKLLSGFDFFRKGRLFKNLKGGGGSFTRNCLPRGGVIFDTSDKISAPLFSMEISKIVQKNINN